MTSLLVLSLALAAPVPKPAAKPADPNEGVWVLKTRESRGRETDMAGRLADTYTLVVSGKDFYFRSYAGTIKFDAEKKTVDMTITAGLYKGETTGGVFERKGDTLRVALPITPRPGAVRPTELKTQPGQSGYLYTFELDKTAKPADKLKQLVAALPDPRAVPANPFAGGPALPALPAVPAAPPLQPRLPVALQQALERIEKLEKRVEELEKAQGKGK